MRNVSVKIMMILSGISFLVLLFGLGWSIQHHYSEREAGQVAQAETGAPERERNSDETIIVALGDSLTRGTGDAEGKGYIGHLVDQLQGKATEKITLYNYGVAGYRSAQLLEQLEQRTIQSQIQSADMILITIGGNDLFQGGQTLLDLDIEKINELREGYLVNLEAIMTELKSLNEQATIFLIGLYNPFIDLNDAELTTDVVRQWNHATSLLLDKHSQTVFVPTFDLFQLQVNDYLYTDKFHPNSAGYRLIAERVASLITW